MKVRFVVRASIKSNGLHNQAMGLEVVTCTDLLTKCQITETNHKSCSFHSFNVRSRSLVFQQTLTCPARIAAAVTTCWVAPVSMAAVTALPTLQPIGAVLTTVKVEITQCIFPPKKTSTFTVETKTHRAGFITVLSPPPWRTGADSIYRVTCGSICT